MTLIELLKQRKAGITDRWLNKALATYSPDASAFMKRQKDRFANPVGDSLRVGTRAVVEILLDDMNPDELCRHLNGIIKIRSIQDFTPSQAVSFVFLLKEAVREELGKELDDPRVLSELAQVERRVDQLALFAFDIYARCREQLFDVRVGELKRSVSTIVKRMNRSGSDIQLEPNWENTRGHEVSEKSAAEARSGPSAAAGPARIVHPVPEEPARGRKPALSDGSAAVVTSTDDARKRS